MTKSEPIQYDLFGEDEAEETVAARCRELASREYECPSCGGHCIGFELNRDHGYDYRTVNNDGGICGYARFQHPMLGSLCIAQWLVQNHLIYAAKRDSGSIPREAEKARALGLDPEKILERHSLGTR